GQGAGTQNQGKVFGFLFAEASFNLATIVDRLANVGHFLDLVVEHDGERFSDVLGSEVKELTAAFRAQVETHQGLAILVPAGFGPAQIASGNGRGAGDEIPLRARIGATLASDAPTGHKHGIGRQHATMFLQGGLLAGIRTAERLPDLQHGGGLHDLFHASGIIHAGKLDQNLILAKTVFLNNRLTDAELIDSIANGLDGLLDRAILDIGQCRRLHRDRPGILGTGVSVIFRQAIADDGAHIGTGFRRDTLDDDLVGSIDRIGLGDLDVVDLLGAKIFLQALDRIIGVGIDGVVYLHLQDEVGASLEIEAEVDAVGHRAQKALP